MAIGGPYPDGSSQIDWGHPLTHGLVRFIVFDGVQAIDLVSMAMIASTGVNFRQRLTSFGPGGETTLVGSAWQIPVLSEAPRNFAMGWVGIQTGSAGPGITVRDATAAGGTILFWRNGGWDVRVGDTDYTAAGTFDLDKLYKALTTSNGSSVKTWVDGNLVLSGGVAGSTAFVSPWYVHQNGTDNTQGAIGVTNILAIWDRGLTDDEAADWTKDPLSFITTGVPEWLFSIPLATAPTLSSPTMTSITATTATPRVTITF